jgi:membrane protein DedA with SNARE-associated domain/pimeloyl-ACP methyl ester carboxylesterase
MASSSMMEMHASLETRGFRPLTPDLPGFERSTRDIPDYSSRAHARYVISWMDSLGIESAHVVAYSMSGAVVLEASQMQPERFRSVTMLSAIGVQELELTGDYHLNHAIHGLQLSSLWLLREATPHFGFLDDAILGVSYAKNFYETDQRPLRGFLAEFAGPMQIVHANDDPMVPIGAAIEHARLVPQAEFVRLTSGGHGLPFSQPDFAASLVASFVDRVEAGQGLTRLAADPARIADAARPYDPSSQPPPSPFTIGLLMVLIALTTFASEDLASIGAGLMAARGTFTFLQATGAALAGIVLGDMALYAAGRWVGRPLVSRAPFSWFVSAEKLEVGEKWFDEKGIRAVLIARFIPGTRLPTYVAAGVLKAPFFKFFGYFLVAALLWTPAIVGASLYLGRQVLVYYEVFEVYAVWVVLGLALILLIAFRIAPLLFSHQGRRRLTGRWMRLTQWEFWPPWVFYPPVVLWCLWLAVRHRSLLAFTAANPGIPHSGFVGESKQDILRRLPAANVAPFEALPADLGPEAGLERVEAFLARRGSAYPVVLKPDVGERGRGVLIADSPETASQFFAKTKGPSLIQEFVPGREFGVFYYRDPATSEGCILSVTDKRFPAVTGDGERTLHELILDDHRAVAMLSVYERVNASRLDTVPARDQSVPLVELGTHCRGAMFVDGTSLITPALTRAISNIADHFPGFHFGRFDLRVPDAQLLAEGREFQIIELNGVTSEATHIYDPSHSLFSAYRTLFNQWELAWLIGLKNMRAGASASGLPAIVRILWQHVRAAA